MNLIIWLAIGAAVGALAAFAAKRRNAVAVYAAGCSMGAALSGMLLIARVSSQPFDQDVFSAAGLGLAAIGAAAAASVISLAIWLRLRP